MSHNLYTINNEGGNVVSYYGFNDGVIYIGRGEYNAYPATFPAGAAAVGTICEFYDTAPINTIDGAVLNYRTGTDWIEYITLPEGNYYIDCNWFAPQLGAGAYQNLISVRDNSSSSWVDNVLTKVYRLSASANQVDPNALPSSISKILQIRPTSPATTQEIAIRVNYCDGATTIYDTSTMSISENHYMLIRKLPIP